MNGAQSLIRSLVDSGVDVCFANPGTSEMHFVSALDEVPGMRGVLGLFEGVATGAADGYARMTGRPAATLMHLGPGLSNGLANLHNARRARSPLVNVVGDHGLIHKRLDAPLESDIDALAGTVSGWVRRSCRPEDVGADAAEAVAAAYGPPGQISTLILPADVSWSDGGAPAAPLPRPAAAVVPDAQLADAAGALGVGEAAALLIGGPVLRERGVIAAGRIAAATGARVYVETFPARLRRGAGLPAIERLGYFAEEAEQQLAGVRQLILAGARAPVAFFAYPGRRGSLVPDGCATITLGELGHDVIDALERLAERVGSGVSPTLQQPTPAPAHSGPLTVQVAADVVAAHVPEEAIVVDEAITASPSMTRATPGSPPHDWLTVTGGAIGQGMPTAVGAAVACPDRRVLNLQADGSAMYTVQSLWTQARERLDVTTVILSNRSYAILNVEMARVQAKLPGEKAGALLDLSGPELDFVQLAGGLGVEGVRATSAEELTAALGRAAAQSGPFLIDAVISAG
jgi:acetolactate synthase I/II/III large subunit